MWDMTPESNISRLDWPQCGICGTRVENFYMITNSDTFGTVTIVAQCHGDTEEVNIPERILADADPKTFHIGTAFMENKNEISGIHRRFT